MEWISALFTNEGVAQSVVVLAAVIAIGLLLSKIKIANISFGITWILFSGIALGIILGSLPFFIPGIPQPVKLGLAGGNFVDTIVN